MRVFAIKDETLDNDTILGYLIYYESAKAFYIELPDNADPWETPLLLSSFVKRGEHSVGSYWSRMWVQQRIIPSDRQNIGQILKEAHLQEYDEFSLLLLAMGRCAQDDCYLEEISVSSLPDELLKRWQYKIEDVVPLEAQRLLVFFRNGEVRIARADSIPGIPRECIPFFRTPERFNRVEVQPDGYGVMWNELAVISDRVLYQNSEKVPLTLQDFTRFVQYRVVNAAEAAAILDCSRQNIDDLMRRGKLHPIRKDSRNKLFLRNEVVQRRKR